MPPQTRLRIFRPETPEQETPDPTENPNGTAPDRSLLSIHETLLELHLQTLDAIHAAARLIAESLRDTPSDHTP